MRSAARFACLQVVQKVRRKDWHEDLLGGGILGVLKAWLEPVNGCLPLLEVMLQAPSISHRTLCSAWKVSRDHAVPETVVVPLVARRCPGASFGFCSFMVVKCWSVHTEEDM